MKKGSVGKLAMLFGIAGGFGDFANIDDTGAYASIHPELEYNDNSRKKVFKKSIDSRIVRRSIPREGPKIGRNEKCSCGSGQKYKNCCLQKDKSKKLGL